MKDPALLYGDRHWDEGLRDEFYAQNPKASQDDPYFLTSVRTYKKRKFEELPETTRIAWIEKLKREIEEQSTKLSEPKTGERHTRANE